MGSNSHMASLIFCFFLLQLLASSRLLLANDCIIPQRSIMNIGAVLNLDSLLGKHQKIAMEIALQEFKSLNCSNLNLKIQNSCGNSARAIASVVDLAQNNQVLAIMGTITHSQATLASEFSDTIKNIPILSLTLPSAKAQLLSTQLPHFFQKSDDISVHMQCIAAIVGKFKWAKVTVIYELSNGFSLDPGILLDLSYSLRLFGSEIDNHLAFPSLSSLLDPKSTIENELNKLKSKSNRVFLIVHSSLELANMLFETANQIGLMGKGSAWIIPDGVAGLLDSANLSVILNMQGVIGFKTYFTKTSKALRKFKYKFRRSFALEYPEEDSIDPSIFALQSYDAAWAIAQAANKSQGKFSLDLFSERIMSSNFERLSGKINFGNGKVLQSPTFTIINVIGKSYREMAFWSPEFGFSENIVRDQVDMNTNNGSSGALSAVYWPGGLQSVPQGFTHSNEDRLLQIGVPSKGAFSQFVNVTYDERSNKTHVTGFSIKVFEAAVRRLPYDLPYKFVPFDGSYDEMVDLVYNKTLDAAVGDTSIMAYRYHLVDFSQPYVESGLEMVVTEQTAKSRQTWAFLEAFTKEMWLMMAGLHFFIVFVIWLIEREVNAELKGLGSMLWFLVNVIFFAHREPIKSPLARTVLAPWLFVILIATSTFTASLTSMMTLSQLVPSVLDIETLRERNSPVGCDGNSFIVKYLTDVLHLKPENIRKINSISDYPAAFQNKEIEAAFFVAPHSKVFLAKYSCKGLMKAGNTYRLGGFGFVFPKSSSLTTDISEALLNVIESGETERFEKDMLSIGGNDSCSPSEAKKDSSIGFQPFLGLFCICSGIATLALLYNLICLLLKNVETLTSHIQVTLTKLSRIWRWTTACFASRHLSRGLRRASSTTEARNVEDTVANSHQSTVVTELVDIVLAAHAS